ncbi:MAG TPA: heparinase II/III family protein [Vicinamibacteria bacterium]|nr:heparinase II/III family protein [Vicinamibacteria bacterium]
MIATVRTPWFQSAPLVTLLAVLPAASLSAPAPSREPRRLLERRTGAIDLRQALAGADTFRPYPTVSDRAAWSVVPEARRKAFVDEAERQLGTEWAILPATRFLDYVRDGNRGRYEQRLFSRRGKLALLVLGELLEGRGRFVDAIADGVWLVCEESYWGVPAHVGAQKRGPGLPDVTEPTVDLFAAETGALLAWTDYLVGDRLDAVHPLVRERLRLEVDRRILTPNLERDDFWWMGFTPREVNNWNPWINSNWLSSVLLLERDPERRLGAARKIARSLDRFVDAYPDDGGCDEGPSYWGRAGASLFESLELLHLATGGRIDVYREPVVRAIGQYIARAYIAGEYYVNIGDAPAKVTPEPELVFRYGRAVGDTSLAGFGAFLAARRGPYGPDDVPRYGSLARVLPALLRGAELAAAAPAEALEGEVWLPDLQMMAAREQPGSSRGLYVAAWGGHNAQSHNHNDVGNAVVYADGQPVLVDVGVEEYTSKTFSPRRYEIWTMQSAWHTLPSINGLDQAAGAEFRARDVVFTPGRDAVRLSLDIAPAYPKEAKVTSWRREVSLDRKKREVVLVERFALGEAREPVRLHFVTPLAPDVSTPGRVTLARRGGPPGAGPVLLYDARQFSASAEEKAVTDARLRPVWGDRLFRIVLTARRPVVRGSHRLAVRAGA